MEKGLLGNFTVPESIVTVASAVAVFRATQFRRNGKPDLRLLVPLVASAAINFNSAAAATSTYSGVEGPFAFGNFSTTELIGAAAAFYSAWLFYTVYRDTIGAVAAGVLGLSYVAAGGMKQGTL